MSLPRPQTIDGLAEFIVEQVEICRKAGRFPTLASIAEFLGESTPESISPACYTTRKHFNVRAGMSPKVWSVFVGKQASYLSGEMCSFRVYGGAGKFKKDWKGSEIIYEESGIIHERGDDVVSDWFYDNGAEPFEHVIAEY